jgi:hypothetical protein
MQEVILRVIYRKRKVLPLWILQTELEELLSKEMKRDNDGFHACFSKACFRMRKGNDIIFTKVNGLEALKKLGREDIINSGRREAKIRHFIYAYKTKE